MHSLYCKQLGRWSPTGRRVPGLLCDIPQVSLPLWLPLPILGEGFEAARPLVPSPAPAAPALLILPAPE
jgi:hypothetical protein